MSLKAPYFLFILLINWPVFLAGQGSHPALRNYSTDQGLPSSEVYEVLQDKRGYLWFGTDNGVSRFDGYEFEHFDAARGLHNNVVFYLHEDHRGRIWMVTYSRNLYYYDYALDSVIAYAYNPILQKEIKNFPAQMGFYVDSLDNIYRTALQKGFIKISPEGTYQLSKISKDSILLASLRVENQLLFSLAFDPKKTISFLGYRGGMVPAYHYESIESEAEATPPFAFHPNQSKLMANRLNFYPLGKEHTFFHFRANSALFRNEDLLWSRASPDFAVFAATKSTTGAVFLGAVYGGGLRKYDSLQALESNEYTSYLPGKSVSHIMEDRDGGYWVTTTENGVYYIRDWNYSIYDESSGLGGQHITALAFQDAAHLYFALKDGTLYLLNIPSQEWIQLPVLGTGEIFDLHWDARNERLIIAGASDIFFYTAELGLKRLSTDWPGRISSRKISRAGNSSRIFISATSGIVQLDVMHPDFYFYSREKMAIGFRALDVHEDHTGRFWAGKMEGLFAYTMDTVLHAVANDHPVFSSRIEDIEELADGTLVLGTKGRGVALWKGDIVQTISEREGLSSSMIERLHVDSSGRLWIATPNGLNRLTFEADGRFRIKVFNTANGLPSNEIVDVESCGSDVWVATSKGLVRLPPDQNTREVYKAPVIEAITSNGVRMPEKDLGRLSHRQNNIKIGFLTLDYSQNGNINYRYRLLPEQGWNSTRQRVVDYPALPQGDYRFEVQSQNNDGKWSAATAIDFSIRPPFWREAWFLILLGGVIAAVGYRFYRRRIKHLEHELSLQLELAQKEREMNRLQRSALRAQMNPHFLSNCLNTIQGFIAKGEKVKGMRYLSDFNRLLRRALDFSQAERISLEEEIQLLKDYIELEKMRFGNCFTYRITVDKAVDPSDTQVPPILVQPYVENAILHAFPEEIGDPAITIACHKEDDDLLITITDNGIGITEANRRKAADPTTKRKSYGMGLTARRLQLMHDGQEKAPVLIEEVRDEKGRVTGTKVSIRIAF